MHMIKSVSSQTTHVTSPFQAFGRKGEEGTGKGEGGKGKGEGGKARDERRKARGRSFPEAPADIRRPGYPYSLDMLIESDTLLVGSDTLALETP
jgi:hypothetical protein